MTLLPAIDLKAGRCVRLLQGRKEDETVYSDDPAAVARRWQEEGATYLHLVDLDGAFEGASGNLAAITRILEAVDIPIELGGGIRSMGDVSRLLSLGLDRVILGTVAIREPDVVRSAVERFGPDRVVVGIDAREGRVAVKGWVETTEVQAVDLALQMKALGIRRVVYTDISTDGMLVGPNIEATQVLAVETGLRVIASGGISSLDDLRRVAALAPFGVEGVIVGKALYEGRVGLREALKAVKRQT
ncbi:MAG: 1-(5-phosphoribosyl)-5-[(5-phosphoribosylamino)methylideneamino]imidazole-4-carboxamide isomerase [Candidatus Latescibacteria bacterium]|nr:1-(5-phosphoribosyl)-5-[(5-phosphoribosylamino)methylideneamino]imidazole-4-carboxamide isomerase [Candidatus Latescibacterota bacterium]